MVVPIFCQGMGHRAACLCSKEQAPKPLNCGLVGMRKDNVVNLARRFNSAKLASPEMALQDALADVGKKGALKEGKQVLIISLDQGKDGYDYSLGFNQAGMTMSECIALCEISKTLFLTEMGYLPE